MGAVCCCQACKCHGGRGLFQHPSRAALLLHSGQQLAAASSALIHPMLLLLLSSLHSIVCRQRSCHHCATQSQLTQRCQLLVRRERPHLLQRADRAHHRLLRGGLQWVGREARGSRGVRDDDACCCGWHFVLVLRNNPVRVPRDKTGPSPLVLTRQAPATLAPGTHTRLQHARQEGACPAQAQQVDLQHQILEWHPHHLGLL